MLSKEQTEQLKEQILQQIEVNFPEDKKQEAKEKILSLESKELETFLKQNKLIKTQENQQNPFRAIVLGDLPSYKIDENKNAIAVLELNPISKGHILVIPKKPLPEGKKILKTISSLAEKVAKKINTKLKPKDIQISASNMFGETIINVLPIYKNETFDSKRNQAKPEELEVLQKSLEEEPKKKIIKKPKTKELKEENIWLPKRIP